jgi:DNA modification methylase
MAIAEEVVTPKYAMYCGDALAIMPSVLRDECVALSLYSPPFATSSGTLYTYSSSELDFSNSSSYAEFFERYAFLVRELHRVTMPGRMSAVHCVDVPSGNTGNDHLIDFPGDIIRLYERCGWRYVARYSVWKEPLGVRNRTLAKSLAHKTIVTDSSKCTVAGADYLLVFRRSGENRVPIAHPVGLTDYAGARQVPADLLRYRGWTGKQTENRYSHWIWRQYASAFWDDIRLERVLPFRDCKEPDDEKHVHALQLDVIERCVQLWTNPGEIVFSPFAGVGSEVYGAVTAGRKGVGCELKLSYWRQAVKNLEAAASGANGITAPQSEMFADSDTMDAPDEAAGA